MLANPLAHSEAASGMGSPASRHERGTNTSPFDDLGPAAICTIEQERGLPTSLARHRDICHAGPEQLVEQGGLSQ